MTAAPPDAAAVIHLEGIVSGRPLDGYLPGRRHGAHVFTASRKVLHLNARLPSALVIRMVEGIRFLTRPEQVTQAAEFFAEHPVPQSGKGLEQILERQRVMTALRERAAPDLNDHFSG